MSKLDEKFDDDKLDIWPEKLNAKRFLFLDDLSHNMFEEILQTLNIICRVIIA